MRGININNLKVLTADISPKSHCDRHLRLCLINTQSVRNKSADLVDYISDCNLDCVCTTETWLTPDDDAERRECKPTGYEITDYPRNITGMEKGGGLAVIHRDSILTERLRAESKASFEFSEWTLTASATSILLVLVYRLSYSVKHPVTMATFFTEFEEFLQSVVLSSRRLLICGDFNIHVDEPNSPDTKRFMDLLESFSLEQHVVTPTHVHGHTLDLIITRTSDSLVNGTPHSDRFLSDHCSVICNLSVAKPPLTTKKRCYRKLGNIDLDQFKKDILNSDLILNTPNNLDNLVTCYNSTLTSLLDEHAPVCTKISTLRPRAPWFTEEIRKAKRQRRKAERRWRKTKSRVDREIFCQLKNRTTFIMNQSRRCYYYNVIQEHSSDQRKLFEVSKNLLNLKKETPFPPHADKLLLANEFCGFFVNKIKDIRVELNNSETSSSLPSSASASTPCHTSFSNFESLTNEDIKSLVLKAPSKSCQLDAIPSQLVKDCIDVLLPAISTMINSSLSTGYFASCWKEAVITPLLKKAGLEPVYNNYRPVSNLSFISKLTEKAVFKQLHSYLTINNLYPYNQSAYRPNHSTETALLKVKNDLLLNMNKQHVTLLVLLDLSAAFDTVDHHILLERLQSDFGISGNALSWLTSYLIDRKQRVSIDSICSQPRDLPCGVPQGSCLGPLLFTLYISGLAAIIEKHLPVGSFYADDSQLYLSFKPDENTEEDKALNAMELCVNDIRKWTLQNKLKLNDGKTEFLLIGTRQQLAKVRLDHINIGNIEVQTSPVARDLGVWFDSLLNMETHVKKISKTSFYYLYNLRRIRKYLSRDVVEKLVHAFITSRLDYCNSLLFGMPGCLISKIQRIQNAAARLVTNSSKYDHITPILYDLHWLPVEYRIQFKILIMAFKCIHGTAPIYLQELISIKGKGRYATRSNQGLLLSVPPIKSKSTLGDRSFTVGAPKLWNRLPLAIRESESIDIFKSLLKTHLFKLAYT